MFRKSVKSGTGLILWTVSLTFFVCSIVCPGCGTVEGKLDPNDKGFHVEIPAGWKTDTYPELALVAYNPLEGPSDNFPEMMMVGVEVYPVNLSLKKYIASLKDSLMDDYSNTRIIEEGPAYISKRPGKYLIFEYTDDNELLKGIVYAIMEKNKGYTLFFISSRSEFDRHSVLFDRLKDTFRIDKQW